MYKDSYQLEEERWERRRKRLRKVKAFMKSIGKKSVKEMSEEELMDGLRKWKSPCSHLFALREGRTFCVVCGLEPKAKLKWCDC